MDEFYKTRAGRQFIDSTMPKIAEELEKLNENIQALVNALRESQGDRKCDGTPS